MAVNIGPKIGIDGEREYRQELANIIQETKTLAAETNEAAAAFKNADDKEKAATEVTEKLNKQIEAQRKLIEKLEDGVEKAAKATGENSTETLKWKEQLAKAKQGLADLESQAKDTTGDVKDLGEAEETASEKTSVFGDVLKANLATEAIKKGLDLTKQAVEKLVSVFIDATKEAAAFADEVNTLSKKTGLSTDAIQEYTYAAELLDVDFSTIEGSLSKLTNKMDDARDGNETAKKAFEDLGVAVTDAQGNLRDTNAVFDDVIEALGEIKNPAERDAAAMDIFGKSARDLNPLIEAGADALADYRKEAKKVGAVLDKDTLSTLNDVQDGLDRLGLSWDALKNQLGAKLGAEALPELEKIVGLFQNLVQTGDIEKFVDGVMNEIGKLVNKLPEYVSKLLKKIPKILKTLAKSDVWNDLGTAIGEILGEVLANAPSILAAGGEMIGSMIQGAVLAIPAAFQRLFSKVDKEMDGLDTVTNEHVENVRKKIAQIPDALSEIETSIGNIDAKQREAERWIDIFGDLSKKINPTKEDTEKLQKAVDKLNELFPELGLKIDEETGKWNYNTREIRKNIQAIADRARADAYYDAAGKRYEQLVELERERALLQEELTTLDAQIGERSDAADQIRDQISAVESLNKKLRSGEITVEEYKKQFDDLGTGLKAQTGTTEIYGEKVDLLDVTLGNLKKRLNDTENEIGNLERQKTPIVDGIGDVDDAIDTLNKDIEWFYKEGDAYAVEAAKRVYRQMQDILGTLDEVKRSGKTKAKLVAEAIADGIVLGLKDKESEIGNQAAAIVQNAIKRMKAVAQIKSPSRVTENLIGKNLGLGVMKGWEETMNPRAIERTFTLSPVFDAMINGGNVENNYSTTNMGGVTMNVYARDGMNIDDLTDQIMLRMQRAVNGRKAVFSNEFHI